ADRNRSHWSTSKTPSYTKSVSWQHHLTNGRIISDFNGVGKVKYHFLTIKRVLFLVYQTISIH
ncbi:hypothetical protein KQJ24_11990, partial [Escherichia sp. S2_ASV_4]|uniref:hypothetical protein n=1 Tax=Escherichia sp. S2_ASV_4 TaxID=2847010 RepID=UPI001C0E9BCB